MASRRTHLGLRRGGSRLTTRVHAPLVAALLGASLALPACSLGQETQAKLELHQENCEAYYAQGDYFRALHQAELALTVDEDNVTMRVAKGLCLLRISKLSGDVALLNRSVAVFDDLVEDVSVEEEYQVYLGHGSAHLQRSLAFDDPITQQRNRLDRGFLDAESAESEERMLAAQIAVQAQDLVAAGASFRAVLGLENHAENSYAMVDLVLVLNSQDRHDAEMIGLAEKALDLITENNAVNGRLLENSGGLPPATRYSLERTIETNGDKERLLRDLLATVHFNKGELLLALEQLTLLADRGLMKEAQYFNRAAIYERLGRFDLAVADLQSFLRKRAAYLDYEDDTLAPDIFRRIDELRSAEAVALRRR